MDTRKLKPQCINCLLSKHLNSYHKLFTDAEKVTLMQGILKIIGNADVCDSAPVIVEKINCYKESLGLISDFSKTKSEFNAYLLSLEEDIQTKINNSSDSFKTALLYAIAGNYIDFGALDNVATKKLDEILLDAQNISVNENVFKNLRKEILSAEKIAYITDNCGEIVLDKLFVKQIINLNPTAEINVIVRGRDVLNDATLVDAEEVGLDKLVSVVGNGTAIAGTQLDRISKESKNIIDNADVIISKGQGNFETLCYCEKNIYYLFLCKCDMFAERFGVEKFTGMLLSEKTL